MAVSLIKRAEALLTASRSENSRGGFDIVTEEAKDILRTLRGRQPKLRGAKARFAVRTLGDVVGRGDSGAKAYSKNFVAKYVTDSKMTKGTREAVIAAAFPELYEKPDPVLTRKVALSNVPEEVREKLETARQGYNAEGFTGGGYYEVRVSQRGKPIGYATHGIFKSADAWDGYGGKVAMFDPKGNPLGELYDFAT